MNKKSDLIIYILCIVLIIPFYYFAKNIDIFKFILGLSIYIVLVSLFSHVSIYDLISKYYKNGYFYSKEKIFKKSIVGVLLINLILIGIVFILGIYIDKLLRINNMWLILVIYGLSIFVIPLIKLLREYLLIHNLKRIGSNLFNIYFLGNLIYLNIGGIILNNIKMDNDYKLIILILSLLVNGLLIIIFTYFFILKKGKKLYRNELQKREEYKINYNILVRNIFVRNSFDSFLKIINLLFYYISIIISFMVIYFKYGNNYIDSYNMIVNTYFYSFGLILIIYLIYLFKNNEVFIVLKKNVLIKKFDYLRENVSKLFMEKINIYLPICLILLFLSKPLWGILFNDYVYGYTLGIGMVYLFVLVIYSFVVKLIACFNKNKDLLCILLSGLVSFIILIVPFISSAFRMGYSLITGSIGALIISHLIVIIVSGIYLKRKYNILIINDIEKVLDIFYKNIVLSIILIILQVIIPLKISNWMQSLMLIIFYFISGVIIYILINIIKKNVKKYKKG